ncbi:MAG TPA: tetratricopeptide repeat protein [Blastocatellia bacterium]|nr:tetratricopeptide repeat protein [Blastocatellia bacterium]
MKHYYEFGPYRLDIDKRLLFRDDESIYLTPKALDTLFVLIENAGTVLEKEELMKRVWPNSFVEEGNLTVNISMIRKCLGERPNWHQYIVTVPGRGYRFVADVKERFIEDVEITVEQSTRSQIITECEESYSFEDEDRLPPAGDTQAAIINGKALAVQPVKVSDTEQTLNKKRSLKRIDKRALIGAAAFSIISAVGIYYFFYNNTGDSIAVVPFVFISTDANNPAGADSEYLSEGITDSIINNLSQLPGLRVIARSSVFHYRDKEMDPRQIGRDLGVRTVLMGRIIQRGDNLTIKTDLSDVRDNSHIWGEQYHRKTSDLLTLEKEIASSIVDNLRVKLTGEDRSRLVKSYTDNPEAYELYLKGRSHWNKRTVEGFRNALTFFQRAIDKDPNYALAYTGLADTYMLLSDWGFMSPVEGYSRARHAVQQALSIDDSLAEAHTSLAGVKVVLDWDWAGAENDYRKAIELNPNYQVARHWYATHLMALGRMQEAITQINQAKRLDPLSLGINKDFAVILLHAGQYDEALNQCKKTLEIDPGYLGMSIYLAQIYELKHMRRQAIAELERAHGLSPDDFEIACALAQVYAAAGKTGEAKTILSKLSLPSMQKQFLPDEMALLYARLGEKDKAFELLKKACEDHYFPVTKVYIDPRFTDMRSDPRYSDLLRCIRLPS